MPAFAFFDVDETVVAVKSMFSFLEHLCAVPALGGRLGAYADVARTLRSEAARGATREQINTAYYALFAGIPAPIVAEAASAWYRRLRAQGDPVFAWSAFEIRRLAAAGCRVVFVSGSFAPLLALLAADLPIEALLCSRPEIVDGRYTGRLLGRPMIGAAKAAALRSFLAERSVPAADCVAYADHISDLPMLEAVGGAVAVNPDAALATQARRRGWRIEDVQGEPDWPVASAAGPASWTATSLVLQEQGQSWLAATREWQTAPRREGCRCGA